MNDEDGDGDVGSLELLADVPIPGEIGAIAVVRGDARAGRADTLFVLTKRGEFAQLGYDQEIGSLVNLSSGTATSTRGQPCEGGPAVAFEAGEKFGVAAVHKGSLVLFRLAPLAAGELQVLAGPKSVRIDSIGLRDLVILPGTSHVVGLNITTRGSQLVSYTVTDDRSTVEAGPFSPQSTLAKASHVRVVPVASPALLVVGANQAAVHSADTGAVLDGCTVQLPAKVTAIGPVGDGTLRWIVGDEHARLHVLVIRTVRNKVVGLSLETLGTSVVSSAIVHMVPDTLFVGSRLSDSQLVRVLDPNSVDESAVADDGTVSLLEHLHSFENLGPIVHFAVRDLDRQGQCQLITCSGGFDGSVRSLRSGVGLSEYASVELPGIKGMWALRSPGADASATAAQNAVVLGFRDSTRVLHVNEEGDLSEEEQPGIDASSPTILAASLGTDLVLHVTPAAVTVTSLSSGAVTGTWSPDSTKGAITVATTNEDGNVIVATGSSGEVTALAVSLDSGSVEAQATVSLQRDIASLDNSPLSSSSSSSSSSAGLVAVATWEDCGLELRQWPSLTLVGRTTLPGDLQAQAVALEDVNGSPSVLAALGDGSLLFYCIEDEDAAGAGEGTAGTDDLPLRLNMVKKLALGTRPPSLCRFGQRTEGGSSMFFAASDRPAVLTEPSSHVARSLAVSPVNLGAVNVACGLDAEALPNSLCLAVGSSLILGSIDDIQRLHVDTVPVGCMPRRVCLVEAENALVLAGVHMVVEDGIAREQDRLHVLDVNSLQELTVVELGEREAVTALLPLGHNAFAVFTALEQPGQTEPSLGRLYTFTLNAQATTMASMLSMTSVTPFDGFCNAMDRLLDDFLALYLMGTLVVVKVPEIDAKTFPLPAGGGGGNGDGTRQKRRRVRHGAKPTGRDGSDGEDANSEDGDALTAPGLLVLPDGVPALETLASAPASIVGMTARTREDLIFLGDVMESVAIFRFIPENREELQPPRLEMVASDYEPTWVTSLVPLSDSLVLAADNCKNVFTLARDVEALHDEERQLLSVVGEFHLGEYVNVMAPGSLSMEPAGVDFAVPLNPILYAGVSGAVGVILTISEESFEVLTKVEDELMSVIHAVGGFSQAAWRSFKSDKRMGGRSNFIDGDFVEQLLELPLADQEKVAAAVGAPLEEIVTLLDPLIQATK
jgi:DNA damage-binding protein 1